jgi:hypothetical protein
MAGRIGLAIGDTITGMVIPDSIVAGTIRCTDTDGVAMAEAIIMVIGMAITTVHMEMVAGMPTGLIHTGHAIL